MSSCREKYDRYFENKNAEFCTIFNFQGGKNVHFISYAYETPKSIRNDSQLLENIEEKLFGSGTTV